MDLAIKGRRALVLGGSRGLGNAIAHALAQEGVEVVIGSRDAERLERAAAEIRSATGGRVVAIPTDMGDPDSVSALFAQAESTLGGIDILVNNHGGPPLGKAVDLDEKSLVEQFHTMVVNVIRLTGLALPAMRERGWGRILTVGSASMIQQAPNMVLSNTLRGAIVGYMKTLADEVAANGITVNILAPSKIYSDRVRSTAEAVAQRDGIPVEAVMARSVADIPVKRYGKPQELGALAAFLCSDQASYMTGSIWRADGGLVRSIV